MLPARQASARTISKKVAKAYEHFCFHYTASDLLVVNTNDIDFVLTEVSGPEELLRRLNEPIKGTQYYLPLSGEGRGQALSV